MTKVKLVDGTILNCENVEFSSGVLKICTKEKTVEELESIFIDKDNINKIVLLTESNEQSGYKIGFTNFIGISYKVGGMKEVELMQPVDLKERRNAIIEGEIKLLKENQNILNMDFVEGNTVEELDNIYNNYSNNMLGFTWYRGLVHHGLQYPVLGGGTWYLEGYKANTNYEWQKVTIYGSSCIQFSRGKDKGVWSEWRKTVYNTDINTGYLESPVQLVTGSLLEYGKKCRRGFTVFNTAGSAEVTDLPNENCSNSYGMVIGNPSNGIFAICVYHRLSGILYINPYYNSYRGWKKFDAIAV